MKRFTFVALLAAAMIVCLTGTARAGGNTVKLPPPRGSGYANASGSVTTVVSGPWWMVNPWGGALQVVVARH